MKTLRDIAGDKEQTYTCDYYYAGSKWSIEIVASSWEEAEQKLRAVGRGEVVGILKASIPLPGGWLGRMIARVVQWLT